MDTLFEIFKKTGQTYKWYRCSQYCLCKIIYSHISQAHLKCKLMTFLSFLIIFCLITSLNNWTNQLDICFFICLFFSVLFYMVLIQSHLMPKQLMISLWPWNLFSHFQPMWYISQKLSVLNSLVINSHLQVYNFCSGIITHSTMFHSEGTMILSFVDKLYSHTNS